MMQAGAMRSRVTFQRLTEAQDDTGAVTETWSTYCVRWAQLRANPVLNAEKFQGQHFRTEIDYVFSVRRDEETKSLTPKFRIVYGSRVFNIQSIVNVEERNAELEIRAYEVQA